MVVVVASSSPSLWEVDMVIGEVKDSSCESIIVGIPLWSSSLLAVTVNTTLSKLYNMSVNLSCAWALDDNFFDMGPPFLVLYGSKKFEIPTCRD